MNNVIASTDALVFAEAGVLGITFHSVAYVTMSRFDGTGVRVMRTDLDPTVYNDTYNLLCAYVLLVDKALEKKTTQSAATPDTNNDPAPR